MSGGRHWKTTASAVKLLEHPKLLTADSNANAIPGSKKFQGSFTKGSLYAKPLEANTVLQDSCRPFQVDLKIFLCVCLLILIYIKREIILLWKLVV